MSYFNKSTDLFQRNKRSYESAQPSLNFTKRPRPQNIHDRGTMTYAYKYLVAGDSCVRSIFDGMRSHLARNDYDVPLFQIERGGYGAEEIITEVEKELQRNTIINGVEYEKYVPEPTVILIAGTCDLYEKNNKAKMIFEDSATVLGCAIMSKLRESKARLASIKKNVKYYVLPVLPRKFEETPPEINLVAALNAGLLKVAVSDTTVVQRVADLFSYFQINDLIDDDQHPTHKCGQYIADIILQLLNFKPKVVTESIASGSESPIREEWFPNEMEQLNINNN